MLGRTKNGGQWRPRHRQRNSFANRQSHFNQLVTITFVFSLYGLKIVAILPTNSHYTNLSCTFRPSPPTQSIMWPCPSPTSKWRTAMGTAPPTTWKSWMETTTRPPLLVRSQVTGGHHWLQGQGQESLCQNRWCCAGKIQIGFSAQPGCLTEFPGDHCACELPCQLFALSVDLLPSYWLEWTTGAENNPKTSRSCGSPGL